MGISFASEEACIPLPPCTRSKNSSPTRYLNTSSPAPTSAWSLHCTCMDGWIPEGIATITTVTNERPLECDTHVGHFSYERVPQETLFAGGKRRQDDSGNVWFLATPLKALADYVYLHRCNWTSSEPLKESLRIEEESLSELKQEDFLEVKGNYPSQRVERFFEGLERELLG